MNYPSNYSSYRTEAIQTARQALQQKPYYLDPETTGINKLSEIVEIAVVDDEENTVFNSLVKPGQAIPAATTAIHKITNKMVETSPTFPILWQQIRILLANHLLAAYNADFDIQMIKQSYTHYRLPWKENLQSFDIMKLYARFRGNWDPGHRSFKLYSLEEAGRASKIDLPNSHRALDDALLARALLHYIAEQPD
jgi:DNA polymerase III subunit epsilon